jgi:hypothetical protein
MKLLKPSDLAVKPHQSDFFSGEYDHLTQKNQGLSPNMSGYQTNSFGGTQTFGSNGQPSDSDNDSDRNQ